MISSMKVIPYLRLALDAIYFFLKMIHTKGKSSKKQSFLPEAVYCILYLCSYAKMLFPNFSPTSNITWNYFSLPTLQNVKVYRTEFHTKTKQSTTQVPELSVHAHNTRKLYLIQLSTVDCHQFSSRCK